MKKKLDLDNFIRFYEKFITIPSWTKIKHSIYDKLKEFLEPYFQDSISTTRVNSKYNHCGYGYTFTVKQVSFDIKGFFFGIISSAWDENTDTIIKIALIIRIFLIFIFIKIKPIQ